MRHSIFILTFHAIISHSFQEGKKHVKKDKYFKHCTWHETTTYIKIEFARDEMCIDDKRIKL
jgi:hypothetical protein